MENQVYRINTDESGTIEFYVCTSNEISPYKVIKEMAIVFINGEKQYDFELRVNDIDSLIKYLTDCKEYIIEFNANAKEMQPQ